MSISKNNWKASKMISRKANSKINRGIGKNWKD